MTLPTFLIIGAPRSGTTSLYHYLKQHPEVFMSGLKEPNYFTPTMPVKLAGPGASWVRAISVTSREAYEALFTAVTTEKSIGEASSRYLATPGTAQRIRETIADVRLVAILRHPVERAHRAYLASRRDGFDPAPTFEAALVSCARGERDAWVLMEYTRSGYYHRNLTRYYRRFPREQIRVYLFDDLLLDARALLRDLFGFLGVDASFRPDMSQRLGRTGTIRNPVLRLLWRKSLPLRTALRPFVAKHLRDRIHARVIRDLDEPSMNPETRFHLLRLYRDDTLQLQDLIGRDLSHWLR